MAKNRSTTPITGIPNCSTKFIALPPNLHAAGRCACVRTKEASSIGCILRLPHSNRPNRSTVLQAQQTVPVPLHNLACTLAARSSPCLACCCHCYQENIEELPHTKHPVQWLALRALTVELPVLERAQHLAFRTFQPLRVNFFGRQRAAPHLLVRTQRWSFLQHDDTFLEPFLAQTW